MSNFDPSLLPSPDTYYRGQFVLKGSKTQYLVKCCFHHDKTESLSLNLKTGMFNCFGCNAKGGDIVDFHQLKTGLSFSEAVKDLGAWVNNQETPEQLAARQQRMANMEQQRQTLRQQSEQAELQEAKAFIAVIQQIIAKAQKPFTTPPYAHAKGLKPHNLLCIDSVELQGFKDPIKPSYTLGYSLHGVLTIAPLTTLEGELVALQVFDGQPDSKGKFARRYVGRPVCLKGYYQIGDWTSTAPKLICESVNDAITLYEATGYPCLAAGSSTQLSTAAVAVRNRHPQSKIVICGDNDSNGIGQKHAQAAATACHGVLVIPNSAKDVNELFLTQGTTAVKELIAHHLSKAPVNKPTTQAPQDAPPQGAYTWLEPQPITSHSEQSDYPIEHLPKPLQELTNEIVNKVQCPIPLVTNAILATLSLAIQGLVNVARDKELVSPVSLYLMAIAESGERKTGSNRLTTEHIIALDNQRYVDDNEARKDYRTALDIWTAEKEGLLQQLKNASKNTQPTQTIKDEIKQLDKEKPQPPRGKTMIYEDATPEGLIKALFTGCPSAGIFSDEAGLVFGSHGMNSESIKRNLATINKLWEGGDVRITRADIENSKLITGRRLTLCLVTQESTVRDFYENSRGLARGTGFGARFLMSWPKSKVGYRPYEEPTELLHKKQFIERTLELSRTPLTINEETGALQPITLSLTVKAKQAWIRFYNDTEQELRAGGELESIKDVTSKAAENVARLAALFHVYEHGITGLISEAHIINAAHIMMWHLMESRRFFGELSLEKELSHAVIFDNWLQKYCLDNHTTRISTMEARQLCPNPVRGKGVLDAVIGQLCELNRVRIITEGKKKTLEVNPYLLEAI